MGVATGIGILAALNHGLVGFARRPPDPARIAFAAASAAAAAGALSVLVLYGITDIDLHIAVMKWAFFPATVVWTVAIVWFVAFITGVQPRWFLYGLSAGFAAMLVVNAALPRGILHEDKGGLKEMDTLGGSVMIMTQSTPHVLQNVTDVLTLIAFAFLCYATYHYYRRPSHQRVWYLWSMTALLAVATFFDAVIEHRVVISFNTLYLSQVSFALVIIAVSLALRREALHVEQELQLYKTHMVALVAERVRDLDEANSRLEQEARERRATEEVLRRRVEELGALQRMAQILAGRSSLDLALDEATDVVARLLTARYARVGLWPEESDGRDERSSGGEGGAGVALSPFDRAAAARAERDRTLVAADAAEWPGVPDALRRQAARDGLGAVLAQPLLATSGPAGSLIIARDATAGSFSAEERQLARTVGDALAAVIEIDRLHRRETRQAAAEERQALARDLHDAVTQSIYSATLIAEALPAVYARDPVEGQRHLERLRRLARAALAEMRTLLFELRPSALRAAPLDTLLERLGDVLAGQADIAVDVRVDQGIDLPPDVKIVLYRVTQEAFSNIAKHARASTAVARVRLQDGQVTLSVSDDGRGLDPRKIHGGHLGLKIMRERLDRIGADFHVESTPGEGTTIRAVWTQPASDRRPLETMGA
jgi:signal transduction histidine kinase